MSEITGTAVAHEAYAFCCMHCGHGWEQAYDIEHHIDGSGRNYVVYKAEGTRVPSPLSSPSCVNCGGHVVRIMRSGQVSSVRALMTERYQAEKSGRTAPVGAEPQEPQEVPTDTEPQEVQEVLVGAESREIPAGSDGRIPDGSPERVSAGVTQGSTAAGQAAEHHHRHWHLSDLLHPFHHRK